MELGQSIVSECGDRVISEEVNPGWGFFVWKKQVHELKNVDDTRPQLTVICQICFVLAHQLM